MPDTSVAPQDTSPPATPDRLRDAVVFSPIAGPGLVEQAVLRLGEAIGLGMLEVGERLPPEAELARHFGIAPMTLRQALAILREAGYVETRRGRGGGTFVTRVAPPAPARSSDVRSSSRNACVGAQSCKSNRCPTSVVRSRKSGKAPSMNSRWPIGLTS